MVTVNSRGRSDWDCDWDCDSLWVWVVLDGDGFFPTVLMEMFHISEDADSDDDDSVAMVVVGVGVGVGSDILWLQGKGRDE